MQNRFSLGGVVRITLDIVDVDVGIVGQTPTIAILRRADGRWFQVSDGTWQATIVDNPMTETDSANLPGRYHFDFDQSLDLLMGSKSYVAKEVNAGDNSILVYEDLEFGLMPATTTVDRCSVQGNIARVDGAPSRGEPVRATLQPVFQDKFGRAVQSDRVIVAYTDDNGDFDLSLVRGGIFRLEIPGIGYDRKVTVPNLSSVLFTDL